MMQLLRGKGIAYLVLFLMGAGLCILQVDQRPALRDIDEAAWISNGRFFDLFVEGKTQDPAWWAFDRYAHHPPIGNYVVGLVLHAVGEPMASMEPRQYWYEHDVDIVLAPLEYKAGLSARVTPGQLMALRWLTAFLLWATVVVASLVARRAGGDLAGLFTGGALFLHPLFMGLGRVGNLDVVGTLAAMVAYLFAIRLAEATTRRQIGLSVAVLALSFTVAFGLKLSGGFLVVPTALIVLLLADKRVERVAALIVATILALLLTYLLDPALYPHPLDETLIRLEWRLDRISIQQVMFPTSRLPALTDRLAYATWLTFVSGPVPLAMATILALAALNRARWSRQTTVFAAIGGLTFVMTVWAVPMAWSRYVAVGVPAVAIVAGLGFSVLASAWREGRRHHVGFAVATVALLITTRVFLEERHGPPPATEKQLQAARMLALAMKEPGADRGLHEALARYFDEIGEVRRATAEREILARPSPSPKDPGVDDSTER